MHWAALKYKQLSVRLTKICLQLSVIFVCVIRPLLLPLEQGLGNIDNICSNPLEGSLMQVVH